MLLELKAFLMTKKSASVADIAAHLNYDEEVVRDMLLQCENKKLIKRVMQPVGCNGSCSSCDQPGLEVVVWCD